LTEFLLAIGFITLFIGKNRNLKFSREYKVLATINMGIIAVNLLLPSIADTFLMSRFYQITLLLLAPLAVIGGEAILNFVLRGNFKKFYTIILVLSVFVPFFLFQTQFVYEVTGDQSYSPTLSGYRWNATELYSNTMTKQKVTGAQWIGQYAGSSTSYIHSDLTTLYGVLVAYGNKSGQNIEFLGGTKTLASNNYVFISDAELFAEGQILNVTLLTPLLEKQNKIYSNGETEIYKGYFP
jgi:uncharacterized membrane protein